MTYPEAIQFLYDCHPAFERRGAEAYKPGLEHVTRLAELFGNPHKRLKCIHIAGTNGKGSTAHSLASVLQHAGLNVGLFTSPHLTDFRERIRINGKMVTPVEVTSWVERYMAMDTNGLEPSFFELTTIMALDLFAARGVDIAVIETGLGGRLDSTNIITPCLSIITGIAMDHTDLLGDTLEKIAHEKAGIIKPGVPAVVGHVATEARQEIQRHGSAGQIVFTDDSPEIITATELPDHTEYLTRHFGEIRSDLVGKWQHCNMEVILHAIQLLPLDISVDAVRQGLASVTATTGLLGRWTVIGLHPLTIFDTGHNPDAWENLARRIAETPAVTRHLVLGFVADKDVDTIIRLVSQIPDLKVYATQPSTSRALACHELKTLIDRHHIPCSVHASVADAYRRAINDAAPDDLVFIGGSNYLIGDLLTALPYLTAQ